MTILISLHRSKFVAQAVPQQLQQCIDSLFQKKEFFGSLLRDVGGPSPNISGEPFQDKTIRKLSGEEWGVRRILPRIPHYVGSYGGY
jgi:hypothetical protein